jgi:sigma-70-like protein
VREDGDFADFYAANYGRTVALVAAMLADRHEAEDIAQEAFARALPRWTRLRRYDSPEAWIRRVALRLAIDSRRRVKRATKAVPSPRSCDRQIRPVQRPEQGVDHSGGTGSLRAHADAAPPSLRPRQPTCGGGVLSAHRQARASHHAVTGERHGLVLRPALGGPVRTAGRYLVRQPLRKQPGWALQELERAKLLVLAEVRAVRLVIGSVTQPFATRRR